MAKQNTPRPQRTKNSSDRKQQDLQRNVADGTDEALTSNEGLRISDDQNSLKAGVRGPSLLEDHLLREKIMHFDHERIPERVVHARGAGAHGHFQVYRSMASLTKAGFLNDPARKTPVFVRFSTVAGSRGSGDLARDARGFAVKFYTEEGNFDLVGNNIPVFFIQDAIKFPDLIHAVKPEPHNEMPQAASAHDTFWDFISLMPESMHMIMWVMSDRAIPRSLRMMEGFGVHTFRFVNERGAACFVKFHWKPLLGVHGVAWDEAVKLNGKDPDFHRRDLWEAIERGDLPEWELGVQVVEESREHAFPFDLLDPTKLIPEELVPVQRIGKLTLDRNPRNFFAETEQVAFHPGHLVPGIDLTDDPLLQGRLFSYSDTQLSRLGSANFNELPINRPIAPVHNNQRDGHMRHTIDAQRVSYSPNTLGGGCPFQASWKDGGFASAPVPVEGTKVRGKSAKFMDHFSQAALFFRSQSAPEQRHLINALRFELAKVQVPAVRERVIGLLAYVDHDLAEGVAQAFDIDVPEVEAPLNHSIPADTDPGSVQPYDEPPLMDRSPALSMAGKSKEPLRTRCVAILAQADGAAQVQAMTKALAREGVRAESIAPTMGALGAVPVDHTLMTSSSVFYDGVVIIGDAKAWGGYPDAKDFLSDAYRHCKTLALIGGAEGLLKAMDLGGTKPDPGIVIGASASAVSKAFLSALARHRHWDRETDPLTGQRPS